MNNLFKYFVQEGKAYQLAQKEEINNLIKSRKFLWINAGSYLIIMVIEYFLSILGKSQALRADAFNNLSGVISTALLIIGTFVATNNKDDDFVGKPISSKNSEDNSFSIQLSRFRLETIFTLTTSFVVILIAGQIIFHGLINLFASSKLIVPNTFSLLGAIVASVLMAIVFGLNRYLGQKLNNASLQAAARDSLGDLVTSLGTLLGLIITTQLKLDWLDGVISIVIGLFILWSGLKIFQESTLNLSDYIDPELEAQMAQAVAQVPGVITVLQLNGRHNGNVLIVDAKVMVNAHIEALEIYRISEYVEHQLAEKFEVFDTNVISIPDPNSV